jgi:hypothetical protein
MFRPLQDLRCQSQGPVAGSKNPAKGLQTDPSPSNGQYTHTKGQQKRKEKKRKGGVILIFRLGKGLKEKGGGKKKVLKNCKFGGGFGGE